MKAKSLFGSIFNFLREHKIFSAILILECLVLIAFGVFLSTRQTISFSKPVNITTSGTGTDESLAKEEQFEIDNIGLHFGGYETTVDYEFVPTEPSAGDEITSGGQISFINTQTGKTIEGVELAMTDLTSEERGRLYIGHSQTVRVVAKSNGNGVLHINSISIRENIGYRFTLFFGLLFAMLLADSIYLFIVSKKISKKTKKVAGAIILIAVLAGLPFFMDVLFDGHDVKFHLERMAALSSEISNGNMPVRMMTDVVNEHAYPNSIFYCDIFLYIPALLHSAFVPLQVCYQFYCILIGLVTCIIAFCCLKKISGNTKVSLVGSALYTLSTYRIIDLTLRASIGELTAMSFLPLVILGIYKIYTTDNPKFRDWAPLGIGVGLIAMCHIISLELCLGFLVLFCLVMAKKTFKIKRLLGLAKAALLCIGIAFWFILPLADYTLNQPVDVMGRGANGFYSQSGAYPVQYMAPFDTATNTYLGDYNNSNAGMQDEMSLGLGVSMLAGLVLVGWILICNRKNQKINKTSYKAIVILTVIGCLALFMGSYLFPWETILAILPGKIAGIIASVQFPWRYISIATVTFAFAITIALSCVEFTTLKKYFNQICLLLVALVVISSAQYMFSVPRTKKNFVLNSASTESSIWVGIGEYLPAGVKLSDAYRNTVKVNEGELEKLDYKKDKSDYLLSYKTQENTGAKVTLPIFAYRYMEATDNSGNKVDISKSDKEMVQLDLEPNSSGDITVKFNPPLMWRVAEIVSIGTIVCCVFMYFHTRKKPTSKTH